MYRELLKSENSILCIAILLLEGYLTLSIEILSIRQLIPFVGNSVIATSLIIGIFLLALALGYQKGGTYVTNFKTVLARNFIIAFYWFGVGLSYVFVLITFAFLRDHLGFNQFFVLVIYLLLVTAPLVYLLGQTVPLVMGLLHNVSHTATISGFVLNLSTIGSFLGAILTSILLLNYLGVAATVFINLLLLAILILMFYTPKERAIIILAISLPVLYYLNITFEQNYFVATNSYGNYRIETKKSQDSEDVNKYFLINESISSVITKEGKGAAYIEYIKDILFNKLKLENKKIVILGAGGFTLTANTDFNNDITYVDIDKNIDTIVIKNNYLSKIQGVFIGQDARDYINKYKNNFDVIISDAYTNRHSIPFHLLTKEYFIGVNNALTQQGIAVFNIIGSPFFKDKYTQSVNNTIQAVFSYCTIIPLDFNEYTNLVYFCYKNTNKKIIYTDNLNSSPVDMMHG